MNGYDPGPHEAGGDYLCLHRNENLFVPRDWTVEAARAGVAEARISSYPDGACHEIRSALAALYGVDVEQVHVSNGADGVLADLFGLLREKYDEVGLLDVGFRVYPLLARRYGYRTRTLPGETFRTGRLAATAWRGLAVVDSPNAITGARVDGKALATLARPGNFLIWDNVYGEFAGDEVGSEICERQAIVRSFSKFYGLAGLRIGYCLAHAELVHGLSSRRDPFAVNSLAQRMALAALERREEFARLAVESARCRERLVVALRRLGFVVDHRSSASFVLVRHDTLAAYWLQRRLRENKIVVRRFQGEPTNDYLRITVPPPAGIERLTGALQSLVGSCLPTPKAETAP